MNNDLISRVSLKKAIEEQRKSKVYSEADERQNVIIDCILYIIDNAEPVEYTFEEAFQKTVCEKRLYCPARPQGMWLITAEDSEGIHRIQCPFCRYEKGSDFIDYITVTFEKLPPFCESCGAEMRKEKRDEQTTD